MARRTRSELEFARTRILVADFRKSWKFYRDVLGLTPVKGHGEPPYGEFQSSAGAMVSLFDRSLMAKAVGLSPGRYDPKNTGRSLLVFSTRDVDEVARRLKRQRVRFVCGPTDREVWHLRTIHFRDPDGYLIEVYSDLPNPGRRA